MKHLMTAVAFCALPLPALSQTAWDDISAALWNGREIQDGTGIIALEAPYRTADDARTVIAATVDAPHGLAIGTITMILDDNPMPVSAIVRFDAPQDRARFDATFRVNRPMPLHAVVETTDGQLFAVDRFVKTGGQGACSAPPGTDPVLALETLGDMTLTVGAQSTGGAAERLAQLSADDARLAVNISHPSHSGMQKDQISLLYIPMRYIETVEIDVDGADYAQIIGSISLSENPELGLSVPQGTESVTVTMIDTDETRASAFNSFTGY